MDATSKFKDTLPTKPETLMLLLDRLKIAYVVHRHPPLRTVEDSKEHRDNMPGMHIKNLYLRDRKKQNFLLVVEEDRQIDMKSLNKIIGCERLSFGSAERLFEMLGVRPGAVSPLTLINDPEKKVHVALDIALKTNGMIYVHPLVNDITLGIEGISTLQFFDYTGHEVQWLDFKSIK